MKQFLEYHETEQWRFDEDKADRICRWMEGLKLWEGEWAGQYIRLMPWQRLHLRNVFGWVDRQTGFRRFRYWFVEVPRKNTKTTFSAPIAGYLLMADGEPGAQVYSAAGDKDQATIVHRSTVNMLRAKPSLYRKLRVIDSDKVVLYPAKNAIYQALSKIADTKHGMNPHGVVYDELHVAPDREMYRVLDSGMGARRQPLFIMLTTAGKERQSLCWDQHEYACKLLHGDIVDDRFYPVIYAAEEGDDWTDEATWIKANPAWGVSINPEHMRQTFQIALNIPSEQSEWKRLRLNIWTNQSERWMNMDRWDACGGELKELGDRPCFGGLDLSSTIDLSTFCLVFPDESDGSYDVLWRTWTPLDTLVDRAKRDNVPYDLWVRNGFITATPGQRIDYRYIRSEIVELASTYNLVDSAYDPYNASNLISELDEEDGLTMVQCRQGVLTLSAPCKELEALVLSELLRTGGNPVARWCANNVAVTRDQNDNIMYTKGKSNGRIDLISSLVMAIWRAIAHREPKKRSVYEERAPYVPD